MTEQERDRLNAYIKQFSDNWQFVFEETIEKEVFGVSIRIDVMEYNGGDCGADKAHVLLQKGELRYECDFIDEHRWENTFFPLELNGVKYLCFRKTLYGFSLLNTETFEEEEYFPFEVLDGEESFIFVDAIAFQGLIVFDGCYWGGPDFYYVYDPKTKKFLDIFQEYRITSTYRGMSVSDGRLILWGRDDGGKKKKLTITYDELQRLLKEKGQDNFY